MATMQESKPSGNPVPGMMESKVDIQSPFRMPSLKFISKDEFHNRLAPMVDASTEDLLAIREKTYAVLDRMDELEASGHKIPVVEFEEILRGAAIVEQLLAERMQGNGRGKADSVLKDYI